jgi:hypothetical protein
MKDDCQLAGNRHTRVFHRAAFGNAHAPCLECAPLPRAQHQAIGCFEQMVANERVATARDPAIKVNLARGIFARDETEDTPTCRDR